LGGQEGGVVARPQEYYRVYASKRSHFYLGKRGGEGAPKRGGTVKEIGRSGSIENIWEETRRRVGTGVTC